MKRFTSEEKTQLVREHSQSGVSVAAFARQNGINPKTFNHWKCTLAKREQENQDKPRNQNKYKNRDNHKNQGNTKESQLLPLTIEETKSNQPPSIITLSFPNGVTVELIDTPIDQISQLINNYTQCSR
ncbi:MAG: transposase [Rikenellaceae bacterium]